VCDDSCGFAKAATALCIHVDGQVGKSFELDTLDPALEFFDDCGELGVDAGNDSAKSYSSDDFAKADLALRHVGDLGEDGRNVLLCSCTSWTFPGSLCPNNLPVGPDSDMSKYGFVGSVSFNCVNQSAL